MLSLYLSSSMGLTVPLRMIEVMAVVTSVRGSTLETYWSQTGIEMTGQRIPERRKSGNMRASDTWTACSLDLVTKEMRMPQTIPQTLCSTTSSPTPARTGAERG